ncbi:lipopolysaccharide biosynthesis protein [Lacibacter sp. H407]|uniref:lipopolysaccharide biosynthesis protein n=1 Tax=Lacibacter sp. H407 TaxID=3133423 RepID=UPI0030C3E3C1
MRLSKAFTTSILWRGFYFLSVLFLNILVARHFEAGRSGQIYYITNMFALAVMLVSLCLETPMGFYLSQKKMTEAQLFVTAVCWSIVVLVPAYFIIGYYANSKEIPLLQNDFKISANAFLAGNLLITFFVALFYAKLDFGLPNTLLVLVNLLLIILLPNNEFVNTYISDSAYINIYFIGFFAQGLLLAIAFFVRHVKWREMHFFPRELIKPFFYFAIVALVTNSMSFLMYRIDYWFVNKYCSPADLGNYIQACKLAQLFFVVPSILAGVVFPMTASGRRIEVNETIQLLSRTMIMLYGLACIALASVGYWLFPFVFGETFSNMFWPFLLLIPAIISYSVIHLLAAYFGGKRVLSIGFWGNVSTLTIIIIGDILFIPSYGIKAAAIISSSGYLFLLCFMIMAHIREYKSSFSAFLIFRRSDWDLLKRTAIDRFSSYKQSRQ